MAGTMTWADAYGIEASPIQLAAPISGGGPNQSFVAPAFSGPGTAQLTGGKGPALSLLGLALALVLLRAAIWLGGEA